MKTISFSIPTGQLDLSIQIVKALFSDSELSDCCVAYTNETMDKLALAQSLGLSVRGAGNSAIAYLNVIVLADSIPANVVYCTHIFADGNGEPKTEMGVWYKESILFSASSVGNGYASSLSFEPSLIRDINGTVVGVQVIAGD